MLVGILEVRMKIFESHSLKEKRSVVKSISLRLRNKFNLAVCESDLHELHNMTELGMAAVSNDRRHMDSMFENILEFLDHDERVELIDVHREVI